MAEAVSLRAYAKRRGVSPATVHRAVKDGRLSAACVTRDHRGSPRIVVALADHEWSEISGGAGISLREFARRRGMTAVSVSRAIKAKRLVRSVIYDRHGAPKIADPSLADQELAASRSLKRAAGSRGADVCTVPPDPVWLEARRRASPYIRFDPVQVGACPRCLLGATFTAELSGIWWATCDPCGTLWTVGRSFESVPVNVADAEEALAAASDMSEADRRFVRDFEDELAFRLMRRLARLRLVKIIQ
jgi:hypothetical protein